MAFRALARLPFFTGAISMCYVVRQKVWRRYVLNPNECSTLRSDWAARQKDKAAIQSASTLKPTLPSSRHSASSLALLPPSQQMLCRKSPIIMKYMFVVRIRDEQLLYITAVDDNCFSGLFVLVSNSLSWWCCCCRNIRPFVWNQLNDRILLNYLCK